MSDQVITRTVIGLLALLALAAVAVLGNYDWLSGPKEIKRGRLVSAATALKPGVTAPEASKVLIEVLGSEGLFVHRGEDDRQWYVSNGREFFESNWVMTVCFKEGLVSGVRFGSADDVNRQPPGAPTATGSCP